MIGWWRVMVQLRVGRRAECVALVREIAMAREVEARYRTCARRVWLRMVEE